MDPFELQGIVCSKQKLKTLTFLEIFNGQHHLVICKDQNVSVGDRIKVTGFWTDSKSTRYEKELVADHINIKGKSLRPPPLGLKSTKECGLPTRIQKRDFDLWSIDNYGLFKRRSVILNKIRTFFLKKDFTQVQTPKIIGVSSQGGSEVFKIKFYGEDAYLAQSPQLYKQKLILANFGKIFEVGPIFRAQSFDTWKHLPQTTCIDVEMECTKLDYILDLIKDFLKDLGVKEIPVYQFNQIPKIVGFSFDLDHDVPNKVLQELGTITDFFIIINYPKSFRPFYAKSMGVLTQSFDLYYKTLELSSGGLREEAYEKLVSNLKSKNLDISSFETYLEPFKYVQLPHGGFGLGFDRLIMALEKINNIREVVLYPRELQNLRWF